jgi:serine/threonine protein kinase/tetratricopeptide (TPR) repeat protein
VPPATFGHYRLETRLGHGGMGEVYRAFDTRLNRPVAVKVMHSAEDKELAVGRFLREARAASALNHPNIVVIHEVGETSEGDYFIVQELIDGLTLRALLEGPMPLARIAEIGAQVARALDAAHTAGIVHRDVKPENVMLRNDGFVKVLDFGLARSLALEGGDDTTTGAVLETMPGVVVGTASYMSPERINGLQCGPPADVFALGVMLYEMAAGTRPFVAPTGLGIVTSIVAEQPVPLTRHNAAIPIAFDDLVQRMLAKNPERRPAARDVEQHLVAMHRSDTFVDQAALSVSARRTTVGRETQRAQLRRVYAGVRERRGLIVAVTGEPGIGKTSLIEDFLNEVASSRTSATIARGRCSERLAGAEAYLPVLEALDSLLHRRDGPSVDDTMKTFAPTWYLEVAKRTFEEVSLAQLRERTPLGSQERMKRELSVLLEELSRVQPLVLFIDDLQWADVSTIDMLNYLAVRLSDMRVLVLASYRPSDMALSQHPFLGVRRDLHARGLFEEIPLPFLEVDDIERYLALQFPSHHFSPGFASMIHARTEGSPLFMADLVRYLRNTGGIVEDTGRWVLANALADVPRGLPESVRSMIERKIEQVDEHDRRLLLTASVQGHQFDSMIVAEAADIDPVEVEERLERLERVHAFVKRGDEQEFPDHTLTLTYQFVHVLYQNMLYASLQPTRRKALSGRVAESLLRHYGDLSSTIAGQLAVLLEGARDFAASAEHFVAAARHSVGLCAFREAVSLSDRGLGALRSLPDGPSRKQHELRLVMTKGRALRSTSGWATPEVEKVFGRARQLCQELDDPPELFPVLCSLTHFHMIRGNLRECRDQADALIAQAEHEANPAFLMAAHHLAGVSREFIGEMLESSMHLERARELHDPAEHAAYSAMYGFDPGMLARAMTSRPLWALGFPDGADRRARETLDLARSQRQPTALAFALVVMQGIHLYRGNFADALVLGDELSALCGEYGLRQEAEWSRAFQGSAMAGAGRLDEGIDLLKDTLAVQQSMNAGLVRPTFLALLGEAFWSAGRVGEGLEAVSEGLAHAERTFQGGYVAELRRVQGQLFHFAGNRDAAEDSFRAAIEYADGQKARSFKLRAATALARLLRTSGRNAEADATLAPVYEWFSEGHDTADLLSARAVLSRIG